MADFTDNTRQPRLGRWWRLWIVCTGWWLVIAVSVTVLFRGWENGLIQMGLAIVSWPLLGLLVGLSIAWVRKGARQ